MSEENHDKEKTENYYHQMESWLKEQEARRDQIIATIETSSEIVKQNKIQLEWQNKYIGTSREEFEEWKIENGYGGSENMNNPIGVDDSLGSFSWALIRLKEGAKVARSGWNGKGMYIKLQKGTDLEFSELNPFLVIKNVKNSFNTWVPSISDLFAEDWEEIE